MEVAHPFGVCNSFLRNIHILFSIQPFLQPFPNNPGRSLKLTALSLFLWSFFISIESRWESSAQGRSWGNEIEGRHQKKGSHYSNDNARQDAQPLFDSHSPAL